MVIDPNRTWAKVEERLAAETDPVLRRNLETVLEHIKAEAVGDIDGLLATLSDDVHPRVRHDRGAMNPAARTGCAVLRGVHRVGRDELQLEVDRLVVDRDCILTEGVMRMAYPGRTLAARGIDVDDPDAYYLYETRMATLWPIDADGKARGEDTYTGGDGFAGIADRKLRPEDIGKLQRRRGIRVPDRRTGDARRASGVPPEAEHRTPRRPRRPRYRRPSQHDHARSGRAFAPAAATTVRATRERRGR